MNPCIHFDGQEAAMAPTIALPDCAAFADVDAAFIMQDNSAAPAYLAGDYILIATQQEAEIGDTVVIATAEGKPRLMKKAFDSFMPFQRGDKPLSEAEVQMIAGVSVGFIRMFRQ